MRGHERTFLPMSRIPLMQVENLSMDQRAQYDRFPSNLTRALLLTDPRLARALPELANALRVSGLDAKTREGAILRVAALSKNAFERMQHLGQARKSGWTHEEVAALESGDATSLPPSFVPILRFVDECVASPRVSDATFDAAREELSDRDLATLILLVGHYMMVARFTDSLGIELDPAPSTWDREH